MKRIGYALVVLVSLASVRPACAQQGSIGTVKTVSGDVRAITAAGASRSLAPGMPIATSDRIVTGPQSGAGLTLRDGTVIVLGASSDVNVSQYAYDSTTREGNLLVQFARGTLRMVSGLMLKQGSANMVVKTRTTTIGIRGTDFIVESEDGE